MNSKQHGLMLVAIVGTSLYLGHRATMWGEAYLEGVRAQSACAWAEPRILEADIDGGMNVLSELCWKKKISNTGNFLAKNAIKDGGHEKVKRTESKSTRRTAQKGIGGTQDRG